MIQELRITSIVTVALWIAGATWSQTNTFPSSGSAGVGTTTPRTTFDVIGALSQTNAGSNQYYYSAGNEYWRIYPAYSDGNMYFTRGAQNPSGGLLDLFKFQGNGSFEAMYGDVVAGADKKLTARYNSTDQYRSTLGWSHLQLGNNGPNWIVAGRTNAGGSMTFVVNNTNDYIYGGFNGIPALHIAAGGNVGVGTTSPAATLDVIKPGNTDVTSNGVRANRPDAQGQFAFMGYGQGSADAYFGSVYTGASGTYGSITLRQYTVGMSFRDALKIDYSGNVGIGTTNPTQKLSVNGTIRAKEVIVEASPWPDDVFAPGYDLPTVDQVAAHIEAEGHLPGVPSAAAVAEQGVALGEMQKTLLRKVEELTLYVIELERKNAALQARVAKLEADE